MTPHRISHWIEDAIQEAMDRDHDATLGDQNYDAASTAALISIAQATRDIAEQLTIANNPHQQPNN